mgnify:CR=1 FL=1
MSDSDQPLRREYPYGQSAMLSLHYARHIAYALSDPHIRTDHLLGGIVQAKTSTLTLIRMRTPPGVIQPLIAGMRRYASQEEELDEHGLAAEALQPTATLLRVQKRHASTVVELLEREEIDSDCLLGGLLMAEHGLGYQILHRAGASLRTYFRSVRG